MSSATWNSFKKITPFILTSVDILASICSRRIWTNIYLHFNTIVYQLMAKCSTYLDVLYLTTFALHFIPCSWLLCPAVDDDDQLLIWKLSICNWNRMKSTTSNGYRGFEIWINKAKKQMLNIYKVWVWQKQFSLIHETTQNILKTIPETWSIYIPGGDCFKLN